MSPLVKESYSVQYEVNIGPRVKNNIITILYSKKWDVRTGLEENVEICLGENNLVGSNSIGYKAINGDYENIQKRRENQQKLNELVAQKIIEDEKIPYNVTKLIPEVAEYVETGKIETIKE